MSALPSAGGGALFAPLFSASAGRLILMTNPAAAKNGMRAMVFMMILFRCSRPFPGSWLLINQVIEILCKAHELKPPDLCSRRHYRF